jgi:hypothetical protein
MSNSVIQAELPPDLLRTAQSFVSKDGKTDLNGLLAQALNFYFVTHTPPMDERVGASARELALHAVSTQALSCACPGWDGHGAEAVAEEACQNARRILGLLPASLPMPSIGAEPDGHLTLEWYRSPSRVLSLSVGPAGELNYAALLGETSRRTGSEVFGSELPHDLVGLIHEVLAA